MHVTLCFFLSLLAQAVFGQSPNSSSNFNIDSLLTAKQTAPLGKSFPSFTALSQGRTVSNELFKNKVVLINFWFEGCHPCMAEMEALNELQQQLKGNKDFLFVSFTWDNPEAIKRVKEKYGLTFRVISKSEEECRRLNFNNGYPTSIILDRTVSIKYLHSGGSMDKKNAREFIMKTLLAEIKSEL